jgi:hypothetical protein
MRRTTFQHNIGVRTLYLQLQGAERHYGLYETEASLAEWDGEELSRRLWARERGKIGDVCAPVVVPCVR